MLKAISAALIAASLIAAPALVSTGAQAAQPAARTTLTTKPVAKVTVKHKRVVSHHRTHKHVRHAGYWKWVKVHGKFVRIFVKKPAIKIVRKHTPVVVKKPVALKKPVTVVR